MPNILNVSILVIDFVLQDAGNEIQWELHHQSSWSLGGKH